MKIDPRRTFRMVIAGSTNHDAIDLSRRAVGRSSARPNPLLLRGETGVGKSLLLHAAANELRRREPRSRIAALTAEEFCNAYVRAIRSASVREFRSSVIDCDALVVDGLEDFETRPSSVEELKRAIEQLVERGKPVLLATGPVWNEALEWMMHSLPDGVNAVVHRPTLNQRVGAMQRLCGRRRRKLSRRMLTTIARRAPTIGEANSELERRLIELRGAVASSQDRRPSLRDD